MIGINISDKMIESHTKKKEFRTIIYPKKYEEIIKNGLKGHGIPLRSEKHVILFDPFNTSEKLVVIPFDLAKPIPSALIFESRFKKEVGVKWNHKKIINSSLK